MSVCAVVLSRNVDRLSDEQVRDALPDGYWLSRDQDPWRAYRVGQRIDKTCDGSVFRLASSQRYFDEYSRDRGYWPQIAAEIEVMRSIFGNVYYSNDVIEDEDITSAPEWTVEDSAVLWEVWREVEARDAANGR